MSSFVVFVEGQMEKKFFQNICSGNIIHYIPNGKTVAAKAIVKQINTLLKQRRVDHLPFLVLLDREKRDVDAKKFAGEICSGLADEGHTDFVVGVADRTIESWILCDLECVKAHFGLKDIKLADPEGRNGKALIKEILRKSPHSYGETEDGVTLLRTARIDKMLQSESCKSFFDEVKRLFSLKDVKCHWLDAKMQSE